jgi:hypothetical protein
MDRWASSSLKPRRCYLRPSQSVKSCPPRTRCSEKSGILCWRRSESIAKRMSSSRFRSARSEPACTSNPTCGCYIDTRPRCCSEGHALRYTSGAAMRQATRMTYHSASRELCRSNSPSQHKIAACAIRRMIATAKISSTKLEPPSYSVQ